MSVRGLLVVLVTFLANVVEAITGFAGTMLAMPPAMLLVGVSEAKVLLNVIALFVSTTIAIQSRKDIRVRETVRISLLMLAGMGVGLHVFRMVPVDRLMRLYGMLLLCVALKGLLFRSKQTTLPRWMLVGIALGAGVIHGMFLSGGALLVIYAVTVLKDKDIIRATLAPVWILLNLLLLGQDLAAGRFTLPLLQLVMLCLPVVALGLFLGNWLHKRIKQSCFTRLTYVLLAVSGVTLVA